MLHHLRRPHFTLTVPGAPLHSSRSQAFLINDDLKPVPPSLRTWGALNYLGFWIADGFNLSSMMIASTAVAAGLSWWQAWLAVWIGYGITAVVIAAQARTGAAYHIGFPVLARSAWGVYGSVWPVLNRVVLAVVWFAFQSWVGGECTKLVLRSLSPSWGNPSAQLSGTTRNDFLSFFIFWLLQFPTTWVSPQKIKHLFTAKAVAMPIAALGLFGWTVGLAGGLGPVVHQKATVSGSTLGWGFVVAVFSQLSNMVTLACNEPDFARLARKRSDVMLPQLLSIPLVFSITSLIGILVSSSSTVLFDGATTWNPLDILSGLLDRDPYNSSTRAGVFFIAAAFIIAQMGTNVAANSLSAGSDLTALLPRYITIKRGQILCALISLCICPWYFASSSSSFTSYLSAYSVLLAPILGVIMCDSYALRRGKIDVPSLYQSHGAARYARGFNWRAYAAYLIGCALNLPGFVAAVSSTLGANVPMGLVRVYQMAFFTGSLSSALCYILFNQLSPVEGGVSVKEKGWYELKEEDTVDFDGTPFAFVQSYVQGDVMEDVEQRSRSASADGDMAEKSEGDKGEGTDSPKPQVTVTPF